jgi:hypothetical protein
MKNIIKKLEQAVLESAPLLEKVEIRETTHKYLGDRGKTHLSLDISFQDNKLNWISVGFQNDVNYQFTITLSRYSWDEYYKSVHFGSRFYDLEEKEQIKRMNYFLRRYCKLVALVTDDENIKRKRELLEKQKEIQARLARM